MQNFDKLLKVRFLEEGPHSYDRVSMLVFVKPVGTFVTFVNGNIRVH